jgi:Right handed beta helix region
MKRILFTALSTSIVLCLAASMLYAAPIRVDCGKKDTISGTLAHLVQTGNTRNVTIFVTGTCKENVVIGAFDHLVIQGSPIATLQDASNGTAAVVTIYSSFDVLLQGLTINGGAFGVNCVQYSYCFLYLDTVQQAAGDGVRFARSNGNLQNNNILNHAGRGIVAVNGSTLVTISNKIIDNGGTGIVVNTGGNLTATSDTIQNNAGPGIRAVDTSVVRAFDLTITANGGDGVALESASSASFEQADTGNIITGNGGSGVAVHDLSFAAFFGSNNVTGNLTQPDVACYPQFSATRGAGTVGGTTNCNEPSSPAGRK